MRKAVIIPAVAAASMAATSAFAYEGPISAIEADVPEASVTEGKFPTAYLDSVSEDVKMAMMEEFEEPVEDGPGLRIEASVLGMELSSDMGTMEGQVAVYGQDGELLTTFDVDLEADTIAGNTDPNAYYEPMVDKFASITADHIDEMPLVDEDAVEGEAG